MRRIATTLTVALALLSIQCRSGRVASNDAQTGAGDDPQLRELRRQGNVLFRRGEYLQAVQIYENGYRQAKLRGKRESAVRFLNNLGGAHYELFHYRDAIRDYLEARDLAASIQDRQLLGALCFNLSSLYLQMGDLDAALTAAEQGRQLPPEATAKFKTKLLTQTARIKRQQHDSARAVTLLQEAIEAARSELDVASEAQAWNELGNTLIELQQFDAAEQSLVEAFRLRKLTRDDRLYFSYEALGRLRMAQGDLPAAALYFARALETAGNVGPSAMWNAYYNRGRVSVAQNRLREGFTDFEAALKSLRHWRVEVLPADSFRISSEVDLHEVYSAFIDAGSRLYEQTGEQRFAQAAFGAAEESRASSLRALWAGPELTERMPDEYWEALAHLRATEVAAIKSDGRGDAATVRKLRLTVAEMEARANLDFPADGPNSEIRDSGIFDRTRRALTPRDVFVGFHLGDERSWRWVVTREGFELSRVPPRVEVAQNAQAFAKAVRDSSPRAAALGTKLYGQLFDRIDRRLLDKPVWKLALDGALFEVPFAALPEADAPGLSIPHYVIERHAVQVVPGASSLFDGTAFDLRGLIVGLGDPIYNSADPRIAPASFSRGPTQIEAVRSDRPTRVLELARLVGSGAEIETFAGIWRARGYEPVLLTGAAANRANLIRALEERAAVLHVAAHVLFPLERSAPGMVALALHPKGGVDLLSATEIASMRAKIGLVVLNGCSSGRGATLPAAGLMGMTRAWLAAGARAVITTRWATKDQDSGDLFNSFYSRVAAVAASPNRPSYAELLQEAQLSELRAGGPRSDPAYWAGYFCVERH